MDSSNNYDDTSDYNELFLAVHNGELNLVHSLLEKYSATETIRGRTLLHVATAGGHAEIAKTLLGNGATIGVQDFEDNTPLDVSLEKGNVQMAEILFKHGAVLSNNDLTYMGPLCNAVERGNFKMVKLLMANGCNTVDIPVEYGSSLKLAVSSGRLDILEYLVKNGEKSIATVKEDELCLFRSLIFEGSLETLKFLVDIGIKAINLDEVFNATFHSGRHDMLKYLVTRLSKINAKTCFKEKQLHLAIRMSQLETVEAIVNEPSNEYESDTFARKLAVYIAVESGSEEILKILLNARYPVTDSLFKFISPLHLAATFEHPRLVKLLLEAGADVNLQTEDCGRTPLHFAASAAQPAVVKFLLNHGADPSKTCKCGELPLKTALEIYSGPIHVFIPVTPSVFDGLVKVTEMLIQYSNSEINEYLFYYAIEIRVSSIINNSKFKSKRSAVVDSVFRPEIVRSIFNYLSEDEVTDFSEPFLLENYGPITYYPPELLELMMEYNIDLKSCFDIEIYTCIKYSKFKLLSIGYSRNVRNLLGTLSEIINDYDEDENDAEKKIKIELLKLLFSRLVLLNTNCDLTPFEDSELNDLIDWQENCIEEKIVMQSTKVNKNLNFTFCDVLTKSMNKVAGYTNNEDFLTAIKSSQIKFPIHADFLKASVEIAERRRNCIDKSTTLMYRMVKKCYRIQISSSDIRHILQYLSIVDLRRFSAACS